MLPCGRAGFKKNAHSDGIGFGDELLTGGFMNQLTRGLIASTLVVLTAFGAQAGSKKQAGESDQVSPSCYQLDPADRRMDQSRCGLAYDSSIIQKMEAELKKLKERAEAAKEGDGSICGVLKAYESMIEELEGANGELGLIAEARAGKTSMREIEQRFADIQENLIMLESSVLGFRCNEDS